MHDSSTVATSSRGQGASRRGAVLVMSLIASSLVFGFCLMFLQLSLTLTKRRSHDVDMQQAFYLAEAGLVEAYCGLSIAKTGNVGTAAQPAGIGDGLFWVEATEAGDGVVELASTGMYGSGRVTLGLVLQRSGRRLTRAGCTPP